MKIMEDSFSKEDNTMSPSNLLNRLHELRKMQLKQQERLHGHQQDSINLADLHQLLNQVSSNSTSYNTFQQLLLGETTTMNSSSCYNTFDELPSENLKTKLVPHQLDLSRDPIEGIALLNTSHGSSPGGTVVNKKNKCFENQKIELDNMPQLSNKLRCSDPTVSKNIEDIMNKKNVTIAGKRPFLRRGTGLIKYGLSEDEVGKRKINSLPWKNRRRPIITNRVTKQKLITDKTNDIIITPVEEKNTVKMSIPHIDHVEKDANDVLCKKTNSVPEKDDLVCTASKLTTGHSKTWAAVLTQEQDSFLRHLKQTSYYKNFASPTKSVVSDISSITSESFSNLLRDKETAEQNMFDLIEHKVSNTSFCSNSSFISKIVNRNINISGESTPLAAQNYLAKYPRALKLHPKPYIEESVCENDSRVETIISDTSKQEEGYETIEESVESSASSSVSCCSCKTENDTKTTTINHDKSGTRFVKIKKPLNKNVKENIPPDSNSEQIVNVDGSDKTHKEMAEMNAKLVATSEMLKERLHELEDEIDVFRKENSELAKMREEIETDRKNFFEEKASFERKFNEEKILSEYYLAEEREKLAKQKLIYEKNIRDLRLKSMKQEKQEVATLKKEIEDLKEQMRSKDARSASSNARLRNQIKVLEKEISELKNECEKLKKENKRIQQTNTATRRLTNIKHLAEINRKLSNFGICDKNSDTDEDNGLSSYKSKLDSLCTNKTIKALNQKKVNGPLKRAKSVPNLKVTSSYAKYFSQRNAESQRCSLRNDYSPEHETDNEIIDVDYTDTRFKKRLSSECGDIGDRTDTFQLPLYSPSHQTHLHPFNDRDLECSPETPRENFVTPKVNNEFNRENLIEKKYLDRFCNLNTMADESKHKNSSSSPINDLNATKLSGRSDCKLTNMSRTSITPKEFIRSDGSKELRYPNGNVKLISVDGKYTKFMYYNGDIKETSLDDGTIKYYFAENKTYHTTQKDGTEVLEFPDGQIEKRFKDGVTEILLPNGSIRYSDPRDTRVAEEWRFPDGTVVSVLRNDEQVIRFPNGQVEVHAKDHKRRQFPDGTVKLIYSDGTTETRFSSGRVRIKDKHGSIIMDSNKAQHNRV